jgi:hypothetical protein
MVLPMQKFRVYYDDPRDGSRCTQVVQASGPLEATEDIRQLGVKIRKVKAITEQGEETCCEQP